MKGKNSVTILIVSDLAAGDSWWAPLHQALTCSRGEQRPHGLGRPPSATTRGVVSIPGWGPA